MSELVEHIINKDLVSANRVFEDKMDLIRERKLYEAKRNYSAVINEVAGGMTAAEIAAKRKAGYKKASDVLQDPRERIKRFDQPEAPSKEPSAPAKKAVSKTELAKRLVAHKLRQYATGGAEEKPTVTKVKPKAKDLKRLAPKGSPRSMSTSDRYERDMEKAKDLESRGSTGKVSTVKKQFRNYRAKQAVRGTGKGIVGALGRVAGEIASSLDESEN